MYFFESVRWSDIKKRHEKGTKINNYKFEKKIIDTPK